MRQSIKYRDAFRIVQSEEELPGDMPDAMWAAINGDRDATAEALRAVARSTKRGIQRKLLEHQRGAP